MATGANRACHRWPHARNHAAFWDDEHLELTPAFDIDPQPRADGEASQAMPYGRDGQRRSNVAQLVSCSDIYHLKRAPAQEIVDQIVTTIREQWFAVANEAALTEVDHSILWERAILNPSIFDPSF